MLNIFQLKNKYLLRVNYKEQDFSLNEVIWIDIIQSNNTNEYQYIQNLFNQHKINFCELMNIKKSKSLLMHKYEFYINSTFYTYNYDKNQINNDIVSFIIHNNCLYTLRKKVSSIFYIYQKSLHKNLIMEENPYELLLNLLELKSDDLSEKMESIYNTIETLSITIINKQQIAEYNHTLMHLTLLENTGWKIRINLLNTEKSIKFLIKKSILSSKQQQYANKILQEITSIIVHNECLLHKINFLTQTIMGFINIEQNRIIKIFSVIFLPPTLIASSYGMNFEYMPELHWIFGYPSAILLMILTGLVPYLYFKYKNWL